MGDGSSHLKRVLRLARKELREILRDRRTIVTLVAMPLLIYPLMSVVFLQFSLMNQTGSDLAPRYIFGTLSAAEESAFLRRVREGERALRRAQESDGDQRAEAKKPAALPEFIPYLDSVRPKNEQERAELRERLEQALREKKIHLIVTMPGAASQALVENPPRADRAFPCKVIALANSPTAQAALAQIDLLFAHANDADLQARLGVPGAEPRITMLRLQRAFLAAPAEDPLAALVPLILILMTITGAVYPAIDLTAGERERGTLEILVAAPVSRFELLSAKYLSVLTVAMLTAVVNLTCMAITVTWSGLFHTKAFSPLLLLSVLCLLLLFAAFFSAVLLCVTSFARSFKEAQAYLIPLMLASMTPGVVAMMPGLKLEGVLSVLPLVNIVLMARDLFEGSVEPVAATIVIVTTLLYALAALALAARVFGAESVLYSEQSNWADLLRRPAEAQPTATIPAMLWCLALMAPIHFVLLALVRSLQPQPADGVLWMVALNLLLFGLLPAVFMYLGRVNIPIGLGLGLPHPWTLLAGGLFGASLWPIQLWLLSESGISRLVEDRSAAALDFFNQAREALGWGVLAVVIVPAILEEIFFRGLLFNAVKRRAGALATIGASAVLFGLAHVVLDSALGLERLVPTTILGVVLSVLCWRAGSLWPSLIAHVIHNTILLIVGINNPGSVQEVPLTWVAAGALGLTLAGLILGWVGNPWTRPK